MLLKTHDFKNWEIIQSSLGNSIDGFSIFKLFSYEDWANNQLPSPLREVINKAGENSTLENRGILEGNWPNYWTYGSFPPRMSSEDYYKIRKVQKDGFKTAIDFIVLCRTMYFLFDLNFVPEKNWPLYFENEIDLVKSKLTDKKLRTRVLRQEIDYGYMSSLMCDYIEEAMVKGLQMLRISMQIEVQVDVEVFENDGWHGSHDPFDLGALFQTYVNIEYLEGIKEIQTNILNRAANEVLDKDVQKSLMEKAIDLINVPSCDKGFYQLNEEKEDCYEKVMNTKLEIINKAKASKKKGSSKDEQFEKIQAFAVQNKNEEPFIELLKKILNSGESITEGKINFINHIQDKYDLRTEKMAFEKASEIYSRIHDGHKKLYKDLSSYQSSKSQFLNKKLGNNN